MSFRYFYLAVLGCLVVSRGHAKQMEAIQIQVHDDAHHLAELMGGPRQLVETWRANRSALISILAGNYHLDAAQATTACDKFVMPALITHASGYVDVFAHMLSHDFTPAELKLLISIYSQPVMQKLVEQQTLLSKQTQEFSGEIIKEVEADIFTTHRDELRRLGINQ